MCNKQEKSMINALGSERAKCLIKTFLQLKYFTPAKLLHVKFANLVKTNLNTSIVY